MRELEALMHFKNFCDKLSSVITEDHDKYNNVKLIKMMIDSQISATKPSYSMIRDFILNICPIKDIISESLLPSIEELSKPGSIKECWNFLNDIH